MAPDRKFKSSRAMNLRCPILITCQSDMDFGDAHNAAMEVRLRKFHFRTLKSPPVAGVQTFLKEHAMDYIVWVTKVAVTPDDELPRPSTETCSDDEPFSEGEKARIKNLTLDGSDRGSDEDVAVETCEETSQRSQESDESERVNEEEVSSSYVDIWVKDLEMISKLREKEPPHSLK